VEKEEQPRPKIGVFAGKREFSGAYRRCGTIPFSLPNVAHIICFPLSTLVRFLTSLLVGGGGWREDGGQRRRRKTAVADGCGRRRRGGGTFSWVAGVGGGGRRRAVNDGGGDVQRTTAGADDDNSDVGMDGRRRISTRRHGWGEEGLLSCWTGWDGAKRESHSCTCVLSCVRYYVPGRTTSPVCFSLPISFL
jgi:hypothetical protein